jgi:flagellar biosynthesis protein
MNFCRTSFGLPLLKHKSAGCRSSLTIPRETVPLSPAPRPTLQKRAAALRYEPGAESLPKVVATARGALAERMLQAAEAAGVPIKKDADLAALLSAVDADSDIPLEAMVAIAEILAVIYRANGRLKEMREAQATQSQGARG